MRPTEGNDVIYGTDGNDRIFGEGGDDILYGDRSDDILDGGAGNDLLIGGEGSDSYWFGRNSGNDVIQEEGLLAAPTGFSSTTTSSAPTCGSRASARPRICWSPLRAPTARYC